MRFKYLLEGSAIALAFATPGLAQDQDPQSVAGQDPASAAATQPDEEGEPVASAEGDREPDVITVTGSRIRVTTFEFLEPAVVVDERYIEERNLTNVANALNELPGFRGSVTPAGAQGSFGQGVNFVNNFGLGSNRTLTLVNGRRFVSSNVPTLFNQGSAGTQVDLNVIPTILVDRIDTVSVGGAPVYGSDAISGTVNVILRTDFTGIEATGTAGITEEGDNFRYNVSIVGGMNFANDRGNITLAYARDREDGVLSNERDFLRKNLGNATNPSTAQAIALRGPGASPIGDGRVNENIGFNDSASDGFPGTIIIRDLTIPFLTQGGLITAAPGAPGAVRNWHFDSDGNLIPFDRGIPFVGINSSGGSEGAFRFNDFGQITSDLERDIFNAFVNFEFTPAVKFFAEGTYFRSRGDELVQQPTFNSSLFGGSSGALTFDVNNPFLTQQARDQLVALGVNRFSISRASTDLADLTGFSENKLYRIVGGLKGDFTLFGRDMNYEVSGNFGRTNITDVRQDVNRQNFINAVNVTTDGSGNIVCNPTPAFQAAPGGVAIADPNCVPLDLFGEGRASQAALDYIISTNTTKSRLEQHVFNANVGGSIFDLPGGQFGFNIGYEHRKEKGSFRPSEFEQQGLGRAVAIAPVSGSYNVDEVFGEVLAPLVAPHNGVPIIHSLQLFARGRYVDNTVNGGFFAWAAGGSYAPIRDIEFRGNYTKSFRAPAITELFLPISNAFSAVPDLCSPANRNAGPDPETRARNCAAFLAVFPNATPLDAASATVPSQSGGNPNLDNEVAKSFTYGAIVRPSFIPGLTLSADYVNIKINQPIANLTVAQIVSACFDNPNFNLSDPANGNAFCSLIRRYPVGTSVTAANGGSAAGQVVSDPLNPGVQTGFVNGNRIKFSGIQGALDYRRPLSGIGLPGSVEVTGDYLFVRRRIVDITGVAPVRTDGTLADPKHAAQVNLRYIHPDFGVTTSINYVGKQLFSRVSRGPDIREIDHLDAYATVNLGAYVDIMKQIRVSASVTNLFNRQGEKYQGELFPASFSDLLGRRYAASIRVRI